MRINTQLLKELNIFLITFFVMTFFAFVALNGSAFARDIKYSLILNSPFTSSDLRQGEILNVPDVVVVEEPKQNAPVLTQLVIPKINSSAPIITPKGNSKSQILASLEAGVGLYPGSVRPGEVGRAVILGHSSKASWYRGDYAYVFTLLSKLKPQDEFYVAMQNKKYVFQVFAAETLSPSATNILLAGPSDGAEVDLITCYPVGSASQRTVIRAKLLRVDTI